MKLSEREANGKLVLRQTYGQYAQYAAGLPTAVFTAAVSIPLGLIIGYVVSLVAIPFVLASSDYDIYKISTNTSTFAFAAVFSFITVLISSSRPGAHAGKISPMEAVRHSGVAAPKKLNGTLRGKKKLVISVTSLSASIILFCVACPPASSFSFAG